MFPGLSTLVNMARKQFHCNVSWFVHLREIWQGNNVSWFAHLNLGNMARKQFHETAGKQCYLVCPPRENMNTKQCFLVYPPPSGNMARKQCFLVWPTFENMA